jgi:hypothetical protein
MFCEVKKRKRIGNENFIISMGVYKILQASAFLLKRSKKLIKSSASCLCPTNLYFNWEVFPYDQGCKYLSTRRRSFSAIYLLKHILFQKMWDYYSST